MRPTVLLALAIILCGMISTGVMAQTADTVYTNGRIYTVNETQPWAEAVAIKDGKFIFVGSAEGAKAFTGADTKVIDLKGGFAMPGIHDTHVHPALVYV